MVATVNFNPIKTTNVRNSFGISSDGYIQGCAMDDFSVRTFLAGGVLASNETLPMWGGNPIVEKIPGTNVTAQGGSIKRAVAGDTITGFSVYDQGYNALQSPQSPAPVYLPGQSLNFYRTGSGARIAVPIDPLFAAALEGGSIGQQASWDFAQYQLTAYNQYEAAKTISAATWSASVATITTSAPHGYSSGITVLVQDTSPVGYEGEHVITVVDSTHFTFPLTTNPGGSSSVGTVAALGGAVPCRILNVNIGNSKVVNWDATNLQATWNNSGACALILI